MEVLKLVNWLRVKSKADMKLDPNAEELTQMKAMKLLYYAQGVFLAVNNRKLFSNDIVAWKYGPVVNEVHQKYLHQRGIVGNSVEDATSDYQQIQKDTEVASVMNAVYDAFGSKSASDLVKMTHSERPWKETKQSDVISPELMKEFFRAEVVTVD